MTFQEIILTLQRYWAERGCVIVQPWDVEKGAGTFNAATYLRSLGPEPWRVAYVEPSRRPTDGRYGENPNRLERHHQFQVMLKPSPKDIQEIYLGSLRAIGIDPLVHDIRFVEDNWESPTLGAWGLGWEVWFDGMEITQFTYFQQCGGYDLDPVSAELTYGLERIAMSLQNVENVYDLQWNDQLTYGEIRHADEVQWSRHNFEAADVQLHLRWFDELKDECLRLCDAGLVIPAYDYCLKCSHVFNILDARGAIGVTERQAYILRVRELARRCAGAYLEHRKELGFPLTAHVTAEPPHNPTDSMSVLDDRAGDGPFLLEVGTEEIPARLAPGAAQRLAEALQACFTEWGVRAEGLRVDCTPRRLVVGFDSVALRQDDRTEIAKGPPKRIAYDAEGQPTRAGQAFLSKIGDGDELFAEETPKGEYLMVRRQLLGQRVDALLAEALPEILGKLHWPKAMRWGYEKTPFVRPIHWLVAALGGRCIDFTFAGVRSGLQSRGHRFHAKDPFRATTFEELSEGLAERKVILSSDERRRRIEQGVHDQAREAGGTPRIDPALLEEVTHITEWPVAMLGHFEPELLDLPEQAVVTPMRVHQRYFPIEKDGVLLPSFVVIGSTEVQDGAVVAHGNARVLRARLADARFFYESDLKRPLEAYLPKLETRIWLAKLGSVWKKVQRLVALVEAVGGDEKAARAALLCKADLATDMVGEFPELQGEMGRVYARRHGEPEEVAQALFESYLPRNAGDALPETLAGTLVALADRVDSIVGCFGIGLKPTGSKDPYALRRQAIAIINILTAMDHESVPRGIGAWIDASLAVYGDALHGTVREEIVEFFAERTRYLHRESLPVDVVDAVVAAGADRPAEVDEKIRALVALRESGDLEPVLTTFKRVGNITKDVPAGATYDPDSLSEPAAQALDRQFRALKRARGDVSGPGDAAAAQLGQLRPYVDRFFDDVLVMADDPAVRASRLGLLASIRDTFSTFADFARIQDRK